MRILDFTLRVARFVLSVVLYCSTYFMTCPKWRGGSESNKQRLLKLNTRIRSAFATEELQNASATDDVVPSTPSEMTCEKHIKVFK